MTISSRYPSEGTQSQLSARILDNYITSNRNVRQPFLDHITQKSLTIHANHQARLLQAENGESALERSMKRYIDEIFNLFESYSVMLNRNIGVAALQIAWTEPNAVTETVEYDRQRQPLRTVTTYRCRFSTKQLSLVIRGQDSTIDFFILPVESVIGLSKTESQHLPLMTFTGEKDGTMVQWEVESKKLTDERCERYCLLLFDYFIEMNGYALEEGSPSISILPAF